MRIPVALFAILAATTAVHGAPAEGLPAIEPRRVGVQPYPTHTMEEWNRILQDAVNPNEQEQRPDTTPARVRIPTTRIIQGQDAAANQFPYQVGVLLEGRAFCGGSVLSSWWILTAGHCVSGFVYWFIYAGNVQWQLGTRSWSTLGIVHPLFQENPISYDIAVVRVAWPGLPLSSTLTVTRLPPLSDANVSYVGLPVTVSGWGKTSDAATSVTATLLYANLTVISNQKCAAVFGSVVHTYNVCAVGAQNQSACNGDSGGPVVTYSSESPKDFKQIGLVSFGGLSCEERLPSAFTRVASFLGWIFATTGVAPSP